MTFETKVPNYFNKLIDNIQDRLYYKRDGVRQS
jgi:hypothetical protein